MGNTIIPAPIRQVEMDFDYHKQVLTNLNPEGLQRINPNDIVKGDQWVNEDLDNTWFDNYEHNRSLVRPFPIKFHGHKTFILVGGSPAVKRNSHFLASLNDDYVIISSNTAARYLHELGVRIDYVFLIEGQHHVEKDFDFDTSGLTLISSPNASWKALKKWRGEIYSYFLASGTKYRKALIDDWGGKSDIDIGGGNVVSTSYLWAYKYLRARHFIVTGMSLCYYDNQPYYYDGRVKPKEPLDYYQKWLKAIDIYGQLVTTTPPLIMYKVWLETYIQYAIKEGGGSFINSTEDGILGVLPEPVKLEKGYSFEPKYIPWISITPLYLAIEGNRLRMEDSKHGSCK